MLGRLRIKVLDALSDSLLEADAGAALGCGLGSLFRRVLSAVGSRLKTGYLVHGWPVQGHRGQSRWIALCIGAVFYSDSNTAGGEICT